MRIFLTIIAMCICLISYAQKKDFSKKVSKQKKEIKEVITITKRYPIDNPQKVVIDTNKTVETIIIKEKKNWDSGGNLAINVTQTSLKNWAAGGNDAFSGLAMFSAFANLKKGKNSWDNFIGIQYGVAKSGETGTQKSIDELKLGSKYGYRIKPKWYIAALFELITQVNTGYNYPNDSVKISDFLAPGYLKAGIGGEYKPNNNFYLFMSPATGKVTFVRDRYLSSTGAFGVAPGEKTFFELGAFMKSAFAKEIMKNINLQTSLELFSAYNNSFGNIDVTWETLINLKVNKYISANISTSMIYDDDVDYIDENLNNQGPQVQLKEVIGVGFSYNFGSKK